MLLPIFQNIGQSSHLLSKKVGALHKTKATHTGTLDPAANGVLIVLTDQDRYKKSLYSKWTKQYSVEVVTGVSTDTHDLLGLPTKIQVQNKVPQLTLNKVVGTYQQVLPAFSAKRVDGKSHFDLARAGKSVPTSSKLISVESISLTKVWQINSKTLLGNHLDKITQISGDFRQEKIHQEWHQQLPQANWYVFSLSITCGHGTYIRGMVRDLSLQHHIPMTVLDLQRTRNGPFSLHDCLNPNTL